MNLYVIYALVVITLFCGGFVNGCSYQQSKAEKTIRDKEHQYQSDAEKIKMLKLKLLIISWSMLLVSCVSVPVVPQKPAMEKVATEPAFMPRIQNFLLGKLPEQTK